MELTEYMSLVRKRWLSVAAFTVLGALAGLVVSALATPVYSATSQVFVSVRGTETTSDLLQGSSFTVRQVLSYVELAKTPRVLAPVVDGLGLAETPEELAERVRTDSPADTVMISMTVDDESAQRAAMIADAVAESLAVVVRELETPEGSGESPVLISTVRAAMAPASPSSPNTTMNVAVGVLAGFALGSGLAVMREMLNTRLRDVADVEAVTEAPVLGVIPFQRDAERAPLTVAATPQSGRAEAFRRLRTNLQFLEFDRGQRAIVTTSAVAGEGKTTTAINLALALAEAGQRVVLVDADLRCPAIAAYLGLEPSVGLTTVLIGRAGLQTVTQPWGGGNLDVITAGKVPPNPSELLGSRAMGALLDELHAVYDVVLIDTSPLLPVTDGAILARLVGGAVVVVGAGRVQRRQVAEALQALDTVAARVLGVVVNRAPLDTDAYAYGYGGSALHGDNGAVMQAPRRRKGKHKRGGLLMRVPGLGHALHSDAEGAASREDGRESPASDASFMRQPPDPRA